MDAFLQRRLQDPRFAQSECRIEATPSSMFSSSWYEQPSRSNRQHRPALKVTRHEASATKEYKSDGKTAPKKTEKKAEKKEEKKKRKKGSDDSATSDGSDGGVCWSDYERTPGTKEGAKGSCRPKGSKKGKE